VTLEKVQPNKETPYEKTTIRVKAKKGTLNEGGGGEGGEANRTRSAKTEIKENASVCGEYV